MNKAPDRYIIAQRHVEDRWPTASMAAILQARAQYDEGTHEMAQGRAGKTILLYSIPREHRTRPRYWFKPL